MACDSCRNCRQCNVERYPFEVNGCNYTKGELIKRAEHEFGCQAGDTIKLTSVAAKCLRDNRIKVRDRRGGWKELEDETVK